MVGVLSFIVTVLFVPGISGAATTPRWALLALVVPWLIPSRPRWTAGHLAAVLLLLWCLASLTWTADINGGALWCLRLGILVGVFFIGAETKDMRPVWIGAGLGLIPSIVMSIAQLYGHGVTHLERFGGLFINANFMAEAAALVLVGLLVERVYWLIPLVLPAVVMPMSRGALLALVVSAVCWSRSRVAYALLALTLVAGAATLWSGYRVGGVEERFAIWTDSLSGLKPLGQGTGSFYLTYPLYAKRTNSFVSRPDHAHNDLLEAAYDLGLGSLLLVALAACVWMAGRSHRARFVALAFAVEAMFEFPLHMPVTAFLAALVAGHLCGSGVGLRQSVDGWRDRYGLRRTRAALRSVATRRKAVAPRTGLKRHARSCGDALSC